MSLWEVGAALAWRRGVGSDAFRANLAAEGAMMLLQFVWVWKVMPETNGIALEDMDFRRVH